MHENHNLIIQNSKLKEFGGLKPENLRLKQEIEILNETNKKKDKVIDEFEQHIGHLNSTIKNLKQKMEN